MLCWLLRRPRVGGGAPRLRGSLLVWIGVNERCVAGSSAAQGRGAQPEEELQRKPQEGILDLLTTVIEAIGPHV